MYPPDSREVLHESPIVIPHIGLEGMLVLPPRPSGLVLFAHGRRIEPAEPAQSLGRGRPSCLQARLPAVRSPDPPGG